MCTVQEQINKLKRDIEKEKDRDARAILEDKLESLQHELTHPQRAIKDVVIEEEE